MAEKLSQTPERHENDAENRAEQAENLTEHAEKTGKHEHHKSTPELSKAAQEAAISSDETKAAEKTGSSQPKDSGFVSREAKKSIYKANLKQVQKRLPPASRAGSKIIHQRAVEAVSNVAGKSVARPSGLLGGGIVALVGTSIYYYVVRHNNDPYNYSVFLLLLIGGFVVGWIAEGLFRTLKSSK